ncbi:LLM class flavin-dependent oxidoreductase [Solirubrobacter soli]|uniref:LLM class flavin-dependent oxidoreductase n=1 Tax=Solirubrobacter soli TaxID=363832 RepID=UPI00040BB98E|nr:LLM class flavin-dependent oxidoreductase [Solirubrobacter soli]
MPDYGHDLAFGTFITPQNQRPEDVVALAQLTEAAGLDLATFQDHPYQPAFLDTWTLLSWVAAQTTTLRVAANVLNLPLRPPAVLARSAASLDLLSKGRLELGLGAGAFWDAIEAMGGPRRTPGEAVTALDEAIDVIRGIWDTSRRGGVKISGSAKGAKRGPAPAHDIEIWLGAYKPRMLRLTGTKADGWLPTLGYLEQIAESNRTIDAAALAAGRDPREIRRLLNITSAELTVDRLLELTTEHGFSTFILASDDPQEIQRFGQEIAPALRDAVAEFRETSGAPSGPPRGANALAARRDGIDYDAAPVDAVEPGDRGYDKVRSTYVRSGTPGLVLRPKDTAEVAHALVYAREQDVPLAVRSGGHGISGRSTNDGGIVIDLGRINEVTLTDGRARVGAGARWGDVAQALAPYGLGMSSGDYGDVGVGGLATAGGIGFLGRKHGLTLDHVTAADVVLADGRIVHADRDEHPDLFWALRGAGGNFGIVTNLELAPYPVGDVVFSRMVFAADADMLERWGRLVEASPRELTSFLTIASDLAQLYTVYAGDTDSAVEALTPLLQAGRLLDQQASLVPYHAVVAPQGGLHTGSSRPPAIRSGLIDHVTPALAQGLVEILPVAPFIQLRAVGGAVNDVDPMATAYAHRHQNFSLNAVSGSLERLNPVWDEVIAPHTDGMYLSFNTDPRPERLAEGFPGATLDRLRELKAVYDPDNVFDQNMPIGDPSTYGDLSPLGAR